jgi:hypothetical protein
MGEGMGEGNEDGLEVLFARVQVQTAEGFMNPSVFPDDWRDHYEERAAILEHCEGLDRKTAERLAFVQIAKRMRAAP